MRALSGRGTPVAIASVTAATMIAQHVAASAARDAFFLANYPASALPAAMIASSLLSVAFLPALARLMTAFGPAVVTPAAAIGSASLLLVEWTFSFRYPTVVAAAFFVHTMVFGSVLVSGFWSLFNERFDPHTAKLLMGRVAGGAALGGIIGGLIVERAGAADIQLPNMLLALVVMQLIAGAGTFRLRSRKAKSAPLAAQASTEPFEGIRSASPYLLGIALLVALIAFVSTITSFLLKAQAAATYADGGDLLRFFARYYLALGLLGFLLQINVARLVLNRFGLAMAIAILPAALGGLGAVALAVPALWSLALLRGADEALTNSLFRSGYELLYTPIAAATKRRFKAIVDIGFDRLGKTLGSGLLALALWLFAGTPTRVLLAIVIVGAAACLVVALRLRRGYVASLTRSLRSQAVSLDANVLDEAITLRTVFADGGVDRNAVLAALAAQAHPADRGDVVDFADGEAAMWGTQKILVRGVREATRAEETAAPIPTVDPLLTDIADLRSTDVRKVRRVLLAGSPLDRCLVPHVVPLLGRDDVSRDAINRLRGDVDRIAGELVDVLLDQDEDGIVRRRLPQVLASSQSQIAVAGLLQALDDPEFEVRFRSAGALVRMREARQDLAISQDLIFEAAVRESRRSRQDIENAGANRAGEPVLDLVFRILSLVLEIEPLRIAQHAFSTDDAHLRGTAIEYLETVLPANVFQELQPFLGARVQTTARSRTAKELESELMASSTAITIDLTGLRKQLRQDGEPDSVTTKAGRDD